MCKVSYLQGQIIENTLSLNSFLLRRIAKSMELSKDDAIFSHCAQRADEPWNVGDDIVPLDRVEEYLCKVVSTGLMLREWKTYSCTVCCIAQQR